MKKTHWIPLLLVWALLSVTQTQAADPIPLRAGPVTMVFEPDNAFLRYIKAGSREILRGITAPDMLDGVAHGVTPQIHAFDNQSIMVTLPILADTVHSARQFIGSSPLLITPINLRLQSVAQAPMPGALPSCVDPRQTSLFAAAWTLGSSKYLAEAGVQGITCCETVGWKGIMESAAGSALPGKFPSKAGEVFPIYDLLRNIGEFNGGQIQRMDSSDTLAVEGLALRHGKRLRLLVANLTPHPQTVALSGLGPSVKVQSLSSSATAPSGQRSTGDDESVGMEVPLLLPAYGVVRIDQGL